MTDEQGMVIFRVFTGILGDLAKRPLNAPQLNIRERIEPVIDKMLAEAREEGRREAGSDK
jgi:hypothetical protein